MKKRKTMAKRKTIVLTLAWVAFLLLLGILSGRKGMQLWSVRVEEKGKCTMSS